MAFFNKNKQGDALISDINSLFDEGIRKKIKTKEQADLAVKTQALLSRLSGDVDETLLQAIYETFRKMSVNIDFMFIYYDRLEDMIHKYVDRQQPYYFDDDDVSMKNADLNVEIELKRLDANKLDADIKAIAKRVVDEDIKRESPDYLALSTQYDVLKNRLNNCIAEMNDLISKVKLNSKIETLLSKERINDFEQYISLSLTDVIDRVNAANERHLEQEQKKNQYNDALENLFGASSMGDTDTSGLDQEVEKTRLELLKEQSKDNDEYLQKISTFDEEEILKALSELSNKVESIRSDVSKDKEELINLFKETYSDTLLKDVGNDLEKRVEFLLSSNPPDYQAAHLKLRACIENYCRYIKGVDLNDGITTTSTKVAQKLKDADIDDKHFNSILRIYCESNPFVHSNEEVTSERIADNDAEHIIEDAKYLVENGFNRYSPKEGVPFYMKAVDDALVEKAKENVASDNEKVDRAIKSQITRAMYLNNNGIAMPQLQLDYSSEQKAKQSYEALLPESNEDKSLPEPAKEDEPAEAPKEEVFESKSLEGIVKNYDEVKKFGFIKAGGEDFFFYISSVVGSTRANPIILQKGDKVKFVTAISDKTGRVVADKVERI